MGSSWEWAAEPGIGANLWRSTGDIRDNWPNVSNIGFSQNGHESFTRPGHWNDTDMLVVGVVGWTYETPHASKLTQNEQLTHIGLWSILAAPMILGNDMTKLDEFTIALMTNEEVLAVDQDALGSQGKRITPPSPPESPNASASAPQQVWARRLLDGTMAVGLFNLAETPARVTITMKELNDGLKMNLSGRQKVRDLWQLRDLEPMSDSFSAEVPRHGMVFVKIGTPRSEAECIADIVKMHAPGTTEPRN
jgi:alpha-galactosidase